MMKFQKINKNLVFGLVLVLCLGMSFTLIAQKVNFYIIVEGGGGGTPPSTPTLYQPPSPDYDGKITLTWSSSARATGYKLYRSATYSGGYQLITTTTQLSYTDQVTSHGFWYYKVKAYNSYGTRTSNIVSVEVPAPPSDPTTLIGSTQRFFPHEETSRLGFTIFGFGTIGFPAIYLSITETATFNGYVEIRVFIDDLEIYHISRNFATNIPEEFNNIGASNLRNEGTHQILVEISNGAGPNNIYRLEYLEVYDLYLRESELYKNKRYSPGLCYEYYTGANDYALVAVDTRLYFDNEDLIISGSTYPSFRSSIAVWIDPDHPDRDYYPFLAHVTETFYLYSISTQWKVVDPDGNYLSWYQLDTGISIHSNYGGSQDFEEIEQIFELIDLLVGIGAAFLPPYLDIPLDLALLGLTPDTDPAYSTAGYLDENTYFGSWTTGNIHVPGMGDEMAPKLTETTAVFDWGGELVSGNYGCYQVVITWKVDVHTQVMYSNVFGAYSYWHEPEFILSETYYLNFQYL